MTVTETIWQEYRSALLAFIHRRVSDLDVAEDILQNIFLRIHAKQALLPDSEYLRAWLYRVTRNTIIDYYRSHDRQMEIDLPDDVDLLVDDTQKDLIDENMAELATCLRPLLSKIPDTYRKAIELTELDGLTRQAAADQMGISLSGMKSRVQRGRTHLREALVSCCQLERDHNGKLIDFETNPDTCGYC